MSNYGKNQTIFSQGDAADSVFYIREGKVKVTVRSDQGKEAVVAIHGKGDFFGEGSLNGQPLRLELSLTPSLTQRTPQLTWLRANALRCALRMKLRQLF